jgi:ABC-2 type transport system ATP-binding protein
MGRCRLVTLVAIMVATAVATSVAVTPPDAQAHAGPTITVRPLTLDVVDGPEGDQRIRLDASLYLPSTATAARPAPVVVLTHGFGGSKDDVDSLARQTAHAGYVAMAYSARGFGRSTGTIGLAAVDYDVADVSQLIDALAEMPEVLLDGPGDPRVGFTGRSYGGGITLMAATADPRIDAIAPRITWSSLDYSLGPNNLLDGDPASSWPATGRPGS